MNYAFPVPNTVDFADSNLFSSSSFFHPLFVFSLYSLIIIIIFVVFFIMSLVFYRHPLNIKKAISKAHSTRLPRHIEFATVMMMMMMKHRFV